MTRSSTVEVVSVTKARSQLSELVSRANSGERVLITRRGQPVAFVIGVDELDRLEQAAGLGQPISVVQTGVEPNSAAWARHLALSLGQDPDLLTQIERGEVHPAMAAYGLWRED
jgi:prevent-host-death family protein